MTGRTRQLLIFGAVFLMFSVRVIQGAELEVSSVVNPTRISLNELVTVTVTISGVNALKAKEPVLDTMTDFTILGPTSTSQNFSFINGRTSIVKSYTYQLRATKIGTFNVGAVTVKVRNRTFSAPATKVEVVKGSQPQPQTSPQSIPRSNIEDRNINGDNEIFIKNFVDKKESYIGEQITLTFELYYRITLLRDTEYEPASTIGFWTAKLPDIPPSTKIIGNRIYQYKAIKTALFPTTSGELTISPASISYVYGGFFTRSSSNILSTEPITIKVKPLPEKGKSPTFKGAVGNFTLSAAADNNTVKVGDVISLKVTVTGKGNLDLITSINTPNFTPFKTYDPKVTEKISNSGFIVGGAKTWEYVIMPKYQGNITIGPFSLSYFDPENETYHTVSTETIDLTVIPGESAAYNKITRDITRQTIENIATDIHYLKPDKKVLINSRKQLYSNIYFYLIYISSFSIFLTAFIVKKRRDVIERNTGLKRRLNAWKNTQKRLNEASMLLKKGNKTGFCGKLSETIIEYIADILNIDSGTFTTDRLEHIIKRNDIPPELSERIKKTLNLCNLVRYSSNGYVQEGVQEHLIQDTISILNDLKTTLQT